MYGLLGGGKKKILFLCWKNTVLFIFKNTVYLVTQRKCIRVLLSFSLLLIQEESSFATRVCRTLGVQRLRPDRINSSTSQMSLSG